MAKPVRFGIIGAGVIAPSHIRAIANQGEEKARLVAIADVDVAKAEKLAGPGVRVYADYKQMLAAADIDAVAVCTPSGMHAQHGVDVLQAGKHLVAEKPVDINLPAVDSLIAARNKSGKTVTVISQERFAPSYWTLRHLAREGKFGRLVHGDATMKWFRAQAYYDSAGWRGTWALDGGGCMMNQGIHTIDQLLWIMGEPVVALSAYTGTLAHERIEVEDSAVAILKFASGAVGVLNFTTNAYPGLHTGLQIHGTKGSAVVENVNLKYLYFDRDGADQPGAYGGGGAKLNFADEFQTASIAAVDGADPASIPDRHTMQYRDFLAALAEGRQPLITIEEARRPVEVILACYKSSQTGKEVRLPL